MSERYPGGFVTKTPPTPSVASAQGIWTLDQALQNIRAGTWPYPAQPDAQWNYVTALFAGTSTSGAQNNTFLDSSSNGFTITRNGNTTQGSFSPYQTNGYWSNYFDGSGDYLTIASTAALQFGTGNFTVEGWYYANTDNSAGSARTLFSIGRYDDGILMRIYPHADSLYVANNVYNWGPSSFALRTWNHVVLVRTSTTLSVFVNGSRVFTTTNSSTVSPTTNTNIGAATHALGEPTFDGYISNFRVIKGAGPYDATQTTLTVPTAPLTAITNTSLLTCQSNRFIDNSASPLTITVNGNTSVQDFSPLGVTTPYSPQTIGGSGYFDGSGDYLSIADQTQFAFGTADWCMEGWVYATYFPTYARLFGQGLEGGSGATSVSLFMVNGSGTSNATAVNVRTGIGGSISDYNGPSLTLNQWYHIAVYRISGTIYLAVNGTVYTARTTAGSMDNPTDPWRIGASSNASPSEFWQGYIAGHRLITGNGNVPYGTSNFTPPTTPPTAVTGTQILASMTNAGIFDAAAANNAETVGNAQVSTTVMKYGPSLYFDGSGDYLKIPDSPNINFGSGNFTVEAWVYPVASPSQPIIVGQWSGSTGGTTLSWCLALSDDANRNLRFLLSSNGSGVLTDTVSSSALTLNAWNHVALVRNGSVFTAYLNGIAATGGTYTISAGTSLYDATNPITVGESSGTGQPFNGYIYDLRITKGYARYWYPFTPPLVPMGTYYAPEVLPAADPLFKYVTMLLPGNGTNGAQNNTFTDSSTNNFTITRNGNTTQGTFSPYGSNWSNYFDTSGDSLTVPYGSTLALGTGDCTIEAWVYLVSYPQQFNNIVDVRESSVSYSNNAISFSVENDGTFNFYAGSYSSATHVLETASGRVSLNAWTHLALTRSSGTTKLYVNGVEEASSANAWNQTSGTATTLYIGNAVVARQVNGYISNLRIVKGTAVYTGAFTPSTTPLTAVSGTALLTCQSNRFIDNSSNAFTITRNGDVSVQRFSPFAPTAAYSTATIGGSGYFDGSGDYLTLATNTALDMGTGNFTVEMWVYSTDASADTQNRRFFATDVNGTASIQIGHVTTTTGVAQYCDNGSLGVLITGTTNILNQWAHIAVVRSSGTVTLYVNGVSEGTPATDTGNKGSASFTIGKYPGASGHMKGFMGSLRVVKGTAVYTSNFTPPTAPLTAITNTSLLTNFTNAGIIDNAMMNDLETAGNAQISTTQSKFGGGSLYNPADTTGAGIRASNSGVGTITGDFTIEWWAYHSNLNSGSNHVMLGPWGINGSPLLVRVDNGTTFQIYMANASRLSISATSAGIAATTWQHYAITRSGSDCRAFVNGNQVGSTWSMTNSLDFSVVSVLSENAGTSLVSDQMPGYIDDLRITKGIARYVQNFTPPTQAFQTS